ncbi:carbohydrate kinase family protein [Halobacterium rubrum]|uniref:carbohydrate kinase family protein n=1 Tax=Halobacterium TaxID=2239 RepID=UPI001F33A57B|nr:PfkB family carbohydrate kinase [Halobacterium rubrum]MDH5020212.1 PfkB family carbohydrate kinase [Halobacterium rubrum]
MHTPEVLVAGETLVDLVPAGSGSLATVSGFAHRPGGAPANLASGLPAVGHSPPALWTRLGDDPFGDFLQSALADHGLDGEFVERGDAPTALAVVAPTEDDGPRFSFYERGTTTLAFDPERVPDPARFECVHVSGVPLAHPEGRRAMLALAERASDAGCLVSVDPNYRPELWRRPDDAGDALGRLCSHADLLCCSAADLAPFGLESLARDDPEAAASAFLDAGPGSVDAGPDTVFLTRGAGGATVASDATGADERVTHSLPAFDVDAVDATGAGDAFCAGVLAEFAPGLSAGRLRDVLAFASAAGALATTQRGGFGALPGEAAVRRLAETTNA